MSGPLDGYDAVLLDVDGTVIRGAETVPEAPDVINELRQAGYAVQFVTNNASRTPDEIADLVDYLIAAVREDLAHAVETVAGFMHTIVARTHAAGIGAR